MASSFKPLRDAIAPTTRVLLVGINPGIRSADDRASLRRLFQSILEASVRVGSHNRTTQGRRRCAAAGVGTGDHESHPAAHAGCSTLRPEEYVAGLRTLRRKVRRLRPEVVAFIGVSLYRAIAGVKGAIPLGAQPGAFDGARIVVLPNPSGRNAHFSYREMLAAFRELKRVAAE